MCLSVDGCRVPRSPAQLICGTVARVALERDLSDQVFRLGEAGDRPVFQISEHRHALGDFWCPVVGENVVPPPHPEVLAPLAVVPPVHVGGEELLVLVGAPVREFVDPEVAHGPHDVRGPHERVLGEGHERREGDGGDRGDANRPDHNHDPSRERGLHERQLGLRGKLRNALHDVVGVVSLPVEEQEPGADAPLALPRAESVPRSVHGRQDIAGDDQVHNERNQTSDGKRHDEILLNISLPAFHRSSTDAILLFIYESPTITPRKKSVL